MRTEFKERYINPFTDYGFKRLFGEEPNKDLLLDFLNELLREKEGEIKELSYLPNEKLPITLGSRRAVFDIYCINERGEQFIVEMQKAEQQFFKDRTVFYSTFPIQEQARNKGYTWDFNLKSVYTIGILDFVFEESEKDQYLHDVKLTEQQNHKVFYDKLNFIYLEMPKFTKELHELETRFDKWLYVLKHLPGLDQRPIELQERVFLKLFKTAEIARLEPREYKKYEDSINAYRDVFNVEKTAEKRGEEREKRKVVKNGLREGIPVEMISKMTGLSEAEIEALR